MRAPTVSVVIPVSNDFDDLVRSLSSMQSQHYANFEILIGDDGSTDDIAGLVEGFGDERIKLFQFKEKQMPGRSRNIPMRYAEGLYIAFCDPGDTWLPEKLERQVGLMERKPKVVLTWANAWFENKEGAKELVYPDPVYIKRDPVETLLPENLILTSTALLRRNTLMVTGLFHERMSLGSEYSLWLRIATQGRLHYDFEPGANLGDTRSDLAAVESAEARIKALEDFEYWAPKKHHKDLTQLYLKKAKKAHAVLLAKEGKVGGAVKAWFGKKG